MAVASFLPESCLYCLVHLLQGCYPPPCGPESLCSLLDEESVVKLCNSGLVDRGRNFQYYVVDSATIIGLLDEQLGSSDGE